MALKNGPPDRADEELGRGLWHQPERWGKRGAGGLLELFLHPSVPSLCFFIFVQNHVFLWFCNATRSVNSIENGLLGIFQRI